MQKIQDNSIDMILCDLPYGTTQCKWDTVIPYEQLWNQYKRILKPIGTVALFGSEPFSSHLRISNISQFKYDWIWKKPKGTGHLNAKKQPMNDYEIISIFQKTSWYNPQFTEGTPYKNKAGKNHAGTESMTDCYGAYTNFRYDNEGKRYPKRIIEFPVVERGTIHPTQKPTELLEYMIKTYTNEGEMVLDNCIGSGSTAIAALNTSRSFIGFELDSTYFSLAKERINKHIEDTNLQDKYLLVS